MPSWWEREGLRSWTESCEWCRRFLDGCRWCWSRQGKSWGFLLYFLDDSKDLEVVVVWCLCVMCYFWSGGNTWTFFFAVVWFWACKITLCTVWGDIHLGRYSTAGEENWFLVSSVLSIFVWVSSLFRLCVVVFLACWMSANLFIFLYLFSIPKSSSVYCSRTVFLLGLFCLLVVFGSSYPGVESSSTRMSFCTSLLFQPLYFCGFFFNHVSGEIALKFYL